MPADSLAHRLAMVEALDLSEEDLEIIEATLANYDRALAALEVFTEQTAWPASQLQPFAAERRRGDS